MVDNQDTLAAVLKYDLARFLPLRIVMRKGDNGNLEGLVEYSFCLGTSSSDVRIWWSGKAYSMIGEHHINGINDAEHNTKPGDLIFDPLAEDCPVEINWVAWRSATQKYGQRNAPFKLKETNETVSI